MTQTTTAAHPPATPGQTEALMPPRRLPQLKLTERELEVLYWLVQEKADSEIAATLKIEVDTVRKHLNSAKVKLSSSTRTGLILWYARSFGFPPYPAPKYS